MLSLVLAAAVITTPATIEESCDPHNLAPFATAPRKDRIANLMEIDRRGQVALAEERRLEEEVAADGERLTAAQGAASKGRWALLLLAAAGLFIALRAARRGSTPLSFAGWLLVVVGGLTAWQLAARAGEMGAAHQTLIARQLAMTQCRARITDAKGQLMLSRIATCTHDLGEVDEDVWGWVSKMKMHPEFAVTQPMLEKLHGEMVDSLRN